MLSCGEFLSRYNQSHISKSCILGLLLAVKAVNSDEEFGGEMFPWVSEENTEETSGVEECNARISYL